MKTTHLCQALFLVGAFFSSAAWAQPAPTPATPAGTNAAPPAAPTTAAPSSAPTNVGTVRAGEGSFLVLPQSQTAGTDAGGGRIIEEDAQKERSTVTQEAIEKQYPTANAYKYLELSPGADVMVSDPFGETGGNIRVRGFNYNEMGFTLEGAPLNDQSTYNFFPQQYVDGENLTQISLTQGSADLDSPHIGSAGGVVNMYLRDPTKTPGAIAEFDFGSDAMTREYVRGDSGIIDDTNIRMFMSYSHLQDDHYRGPGDDSRDHIDIKAVSEFGDGDRVSLSLMLNRDMNIYYTTPTKAQYASGSFNWDAVFTGPADVNFYQLHPNNYLSAVVSAPSSFPLTDKFELDVTPYLWWDDGDGGATGTSLQLSPTAGFFEGNQKVFPQNLAGPTAANGSVLVANLSRNPEVRPGVIFEGHYQAPYNNKLVGGYWFEYAYQHNYSVYSLLDQNGAPLNPWATATTVTLTNGAQAFNLNQRTSSIVNGLFIGDEVSFLNDRGTIDFGVKRVFTYRQTNDEVPGGTSVTLNDAQWTPTFGFRYKVDPANQVFGSFNTSFRSPPVAGLVTLFSNTTGKPTQAADSATQDEYVFTEEIGYRHQDDIGDASVSFFHYDEYNRQVTTAVLVGAVMENESLNAGNTDANGVDFEAGLRPYQNFRPYVSGEWLRATQTTDYVDGHDFLPTNGKNAIASPHWLAAVSLDYDNGKYFGVISGKYVGPQYATFNNDEQLAGYATADLALGMRLPGIGGAQGLELRLNLENFTNNRFLSGVSTPEPNAHTAKGIYGSTLAGTPPQYYVSSSFAAIVTVKANF